MDTDRPENKTEPQTQPDREPPAGDVGAADANRAAAGHDQPPSEAARPDPAQQQIVAGLGRVERLLEQIVEDQQQTRREQQVSEFSLADVLASLAQVVAIAGVLGAVLAMLQAPPDRGLAALALLGAIAVQGLALTLFMLRRR